MVKPGPVDNSLSIVFILDTSGSMDSKILQEVLTEAHTILKALNLNQVWFLQADCRVTKEPYKVRVGDLLRPFPITGGGGTDFDSALKRAEKIKPRPHLILYLTDCYGDVTYQPKVPVVWVSFGKTHNMPFGTLIPVNNT